MGDLVARMADTQKETGDALPLNSAGGSQVKGKWDSLGNQSVFSHHFVYKARTLRSQANT